MPARPSLPVLVCLGALAALAAAGCSKPAISFATAPGADLASFRTIALDPRKDMALVVEGMRPLNPAYLRPLATQNLAARGYTILPEEEGGTADLWLDLFAFGPGQGRPEAPSGDTGKGGGGRGGGGHGRGAGGRQEGGGMAPDKGSSPRGGQGHGRLVVQFVERASGKILWSGIWEDSPRKGQPGSRGKDPLVEHLQEILAQLPPRGGAK